MESGAMVEAGAVFAALLAALRVIEKLVDKRLNNGGPKPVTIDLNQGELASNMGAMSETLSATGQTLERINERIDDVNERSAKLETLAENINRVTVETGGNVYKIKEQLNLEAVKAEAKEQGRREALLSERGES
jgi:DNA anti-recombination protein RmuC